MEPTEEQFQSRSLDIRTVRIVEKRPSDTIYMIINNSHV